MKKVNHYSVGFVLFAKFPRSIKYLILKQHQGHWGFPKGHREKDETLLETAIRELKEETGIKKINLLSKKVFHKDNYVIKNKDIQINKNVSYFIAEAKDTKVKIDGKEILKYKWCTYNKASEYVTFKESKNVLKKTKKFIKANFNYD